MKNLIKTTIILSSVLFLYQPIYATTITYNSTHISGTQWEYTYSVANDTLGVDIEEFTIFFNLGLYENLVATNTPTDWDPLAINPDPNIPDDGYYDALALSFGISPGETLSGFSVLFDYLGAEAPGSQSFNIVDWDFSILDSGDTIADSAPVPEPATILLIGSGLIGFVGLKRKFIK